MPDKSVVLDNLVKVYGAITAVDGISLEVEGGTVFGLLGPNGAGKTTTLRILTTVTRPTAGAAYVGGLDVLRRGVEVRRLIGVVAQQDYLDSYLTARENLVLHARMHDLSPDEYNPRIDHLLRFMELDRRQHDFPKTYSGGMQRRLSLARALVHQPRVLFLDEPTTGLDPQARRAMWDYLRGLAGSVTVFLTTHYMEEAEILAQRVAIMDRGKILAQGSPAELQARLGEAGSYDVRVRGDRERYAAALRALPGVKACVVEDDALHLELVDAGRIKAVLDEIDDQDLVGVTQRQPTLEDVFIHLTGRSLRD